MKNKVNTNNAETARASANVRKTKQQKIEVAAYVLTLVSFIIPVIYLIFKIIFGKFDGAGAGYHSRADYILMIVQCLLGVLVINLPSILGKKFRFEVPPFLYVFYIFFLYCAIFLGEVRSFYYKFKWWDSFLHGTSSLMLGFFGFMVITILNRDAKALMNLSPFFVSLFAFCFAVSIGALWEIYEFTFDGLLGFNMQKFMLANGKMLEGHDALRDTMKDIITDSLGALTATIIGYIGLKKNKTWLIPKITEEAETQADGAAVAGNIPAEAIIPESVSESAASEIEKANAE